VGAISLPDLCTKSKTRAFRTRHTAVRSGDYGVTPHVLVDPTFAVMGYGERKRRKERCP